MNVMNKVIGYIPREFSEDEGFQQRDIDEAYHFEERDDIAQENLTRRLTNGISTGVMIWIRSEHGIIVPQVTESHSYYRQVG